VTRPLNNLLVAYDYEQILSASQGFLIRERFFWSQVFCATCERRTQFKVAQWDPTMPDRIEDDLFQAQSAMAEVREESECCERYCCHQARGLKLGWFPPMDTSDSMGYAEQPGWPAGVPPMLVMDRPFKCPCTVCCMPFEMTVSDPQQGPIGKAVYDCRWYNYLWCCDQHMNLYDGDGNPTYTVHSPMCCGGCCAPDGQSRCMTNCCAPSCFSSTFSSTVHDAQTGALVGSWENQWPGCNTRGLCQGNSAASNYVLKFPPQATAANKAQILNGMFLANYLYFEKRANQK